MKHHAKYAIALLLSVITLTSFSQSNIVKPQQFSRFPSIINCSQVELAKVFTATPGQTISIDFSSNFIFSGIVKSNIVKYSNLQSAIVESPDYSNTIFSVSRITADDGTYAYVGRIINKNFFDGFELKQNHAGNYQLIKVETDKVIQDCRQN